MYCHWSLYFVFARSIESQVDSAPTARHVGPDLREHYRHCFRCYCSHIHLFKPAGVSHPIQTFSYALKLKLEFVVLNQLMAVAARGMQKHPWEERRYHNADPMDDFSAECRKWAEKSSVPPIQADEHSEESPDCEVGDVSEETSKPPSVLSRSSRTSAILQGQEGNFDPTNLDTVNFGAEPRLELQTFYDERDSRIVSAPTLQTMPSQTFSGETLQPPEDAAREESPHLFPRHPHRGQEKATISTPTHWARRALKTHQWK